MGDEVTREYTNGEITIVWRPDICIGSSICVSMLPDVYDHDARPWVKIQNATTEELKYQISCCPSGALSYYENKKENDSESD